MTEINLEHKYAKKKVSDLVPYANNSRTHDDAQVAQIAASMREFGFTNPVLIDEEGGIIAGHGRILAAQQLDIQKVPCITLIGLSEEQKKAYIIADNQLPLNAGWDLDMLKSEILELQEAEYDIDIMGFEPDFLDDLLLDDIDDSLTDPEEVGAPVENPVSKPGDIWLLGNHRLLCGDSTNIDAVEAMMDGDLADQLITDPPYNVDYTGKTKEALTIDNDSMSDDAFRQFLKDAYTTADAVMKPGAVFYIWHADSEGYNFRGAAHDMGWQVRQCLIWKKQHMVMGRQDYHWMHEPCLYGWKDGSAHLWATDRKQTTILEFNRPQRNDVHPTMKPVELIEYQIKNNTKGKDIVLDLFGGSGSTLIACETSGRHCRMVELDPVYVDVIVNRYQEFTGKNAVHLETGKTYDELIK